MHKINGEYQDGNCSVWLKGGEPYLILNLESYYQFKSLGGRHCDFVYVLCKDDEVIIFIVELKELNEADKGNIRESIQGKFSQTLRVLESQILPFLEIKNNKKIKYYAVLAAPSGIIGKIGALIRHDSSLFGELRNYHRAWLTACGDSVWSQVISLK